MKQISKMNCNICDNPVIDDLRTLIDEGTATEEYLRANEKLCQLKDELKSALNIKIEDEDKHYKQIFDVGESESEIYTILSGEGFIMGFKTAVKLLVEALS